MAYDKNELEKLSLEAIKENNLVNISEVVSFLPIKSRKTFYNQELHELPTIKEALYDNRVSTKVQIRRKWLDSDNATLQISLYKLIADDDERQKLSQTYQNVDHTTKGESMNVISLGRGINPEDDGATS